VGIRLRGVEDIKTKTSKVIQFEGRDLGGN
jgi:hypothetical protein